MLINGKEYRTVWYEDGVIFTVEQRSLPHKFEIVKLFTHKDVYNSIKEMMIRGAPAIGAMGCFGMAQAIFNFDGEHFDEYVQEISTFLKSARPTAYDLTHGINFLLDKIKDKEVKEAKEIAQVESQKYADESAQACKKIGEHGAELIKDGMGLLTHCNAGALATVDWGTALAPMRIANSQGKKYHVYADETRPLCQGAKITSFELVQEGISHDIIVDNAAGYFMQKGKVDLVIVGTDRVAANGDVANKIGTYEKAVIAYENNIPVYVAAPFSTIDFDCPTGNDIPIEERDQDEILFVEGLNDKGEIVKVKIGPENASAKNIAFDVTPAKFITGFITEKGIFKPGELANARSL